MDSGSLAIYSSSGQLDCILCNVSGYSASQWARHIKSARHQVKVEERRQATLGKRKAGSVQDDGSGKWRKVQNPRRNNNHTKQTTNTASTSRLSWIPNSPSNTPWPNSAEQDVETEFTPIEQPTGLHRGRNSVAALSLDGGSFLVLSELLILEEIMVRLQSHLNLETIPSPCDHFDMIGGSGMGGIVAIFLSRLKMTVAAAIEHFIDFYRSLYDVPMDNALRSERLADAIMALVRSHLKEGDPDERLAERNPECKMFVCATPAAAVTGYKPERFRNYRSRKFNAFDCKIWEAARATTAHPALFSSIRIGPINRQEEYLDPGFGFNNPIELVMEDAMDLYPSCSNFLFLSIGAGHPGTFSAPLNGEGLYSLLENITRDCERTANQVQERGQKGYIRLNVAQGFQGLGVHLWTDPGVIATHTKQYLASASVDHHLEDIVKYLAHRYRFVKGSGDSHSSNLSPRNLTLLAQLPQVSMFDIQMGLDLVVRCNYRFCIGNVRAERKVL
ncbi:acyl transferase/acyl hydrolase/lysophospholipase [Flagelloscypha sp. PMI_526]|nr:acyl transferase/acyl hydrolase/lysophospholipase [Flagelloscypha sp. PMI_526]